VLAAGAVVVVTAFDAALDVAVWLAVEAAALVLAAALLEAVVTAEGVTPPILFVSAEVLPDVAALPPAPQAARRVSAPAPAVSRLRNCRREAVGSS